MKKIAILVIASLNELYQVYIDNYWKKMINYCYQYYPHIKIFLLFDYNTDLSNYQDIINNIIIDQTIFYNNFFPEGEKIGGFIPGILSKTIYALEKLSNYYDIFFRTNLSSMIILKNFNDYIQNNDIHYSGFYIWKDGLRDDLIFHNKVGQDKSIKFLEELNQYPGNTFISGSAYFLNQDNIITILKNKLKIRYDIIDDVSVGLLLSTHSSVPYHYHLCINNNTNIEEVITSIKNHSNTGFHIRLNHLSIENANLLHTQLRIKNLYNLFE